MKKIVFTSAFLLTPFVAFAADPDLNKLQQLLKAFGNLIDTAVPIIFALAVLGFLYGLAVYILGGATNHEKGKNIMIWGVIALTVMAAVWGLVNFVASSFGLTPGESAPGLTGIVPPTP